MVRSSLAVAALMSLTACRDWASARAGQMLLQILAVAPDQPQRMEAGILHRLLRDGLRRQLLRCILLCLLHCYRLQDRVRYSLLFCWMRYRLIA